MLTNTRILNRLVALAALLLVLMCIVGGIGFYTSSQIRDSLHRVYRDRIVALGLLDQINTEHHHSRHDLFSAIYSRDPAVVTQKKQQIAERDDRVRKQWSDFLKTQLTPKEKQLAASTALAMQNYDARRRETLARLESGDWDGAKTSSMPATSAAYHEFTSNLDKLSQLQIDIASAEYASAQAGAAKARTLLISLILAALAGGTAMAFAISRSISLPLGRAIEAMQRLTGGQLETEVTDQKRRDEVGDVARAVAFFKESMIEAERLRESEAKIRFFSTLNAAVEALPVTVAIIDSDAKFTFLDHKWEKLFQELGPEYSTVGSSYLDLADYVFENDLEVAQALKTGTREVLNGKRDLFQLELDLLMRGKIHRFSTSIAPLPKDMGGAVIMTRDITEQTRRENELKICGEAIEAALTPIALASTEGVFTYVNKAFLEVWGYEDPSRILGKTGEGLWADGVDLESLKAEFDKTGFLSREFNARRQDDTIAPLWVTASIVKNAEGQPLCIISSYMDLTTRVKMERALRESEHYNRTLFETSPIGLVLSRIDGTFLDLNSAYARILGRTIEEAKKIHYWDITPKEYSEIEQIQRDSLLKTGRYGPFEKEYFNKDGDRVPVRLQGSLIEISGETYVWSSVEDISESKKAEVRLRESEEYNRMLLENFPVGLALSEEWGAFLHVNEAFAAIMGYSVEEATGLHYKDISPPEYAELDIEQGKLLQKHGRCGPYEKEYFHKDGHRIPVRATGVLIQRGDTPYVLASVEDITKQLKIDEQIRQSQKLQSIGTLAGGISHEINNLLTPIMGLTELVRDDLTDAVSVQNLDDVLNAAERARQIVAQVLAFSHKDQPRRQQMALVPAVENAIDLVRVALPSNITVVTSMQPAPMVEMDDTQIQQVVVNLCSNAAHAMGLKGGRLEITVTGKSPDPGFFENHPHAVPGEYAVLSVRDNGCGMSKKVLSRAFEPFFTTKEVGVGTGMGLSVVHGIVTSHKGEIEIESAPEKGTTIKIYLPAA